jgi:hypothetical protein
MVPFAELATRHATTSASIALALAAEFTPVRATRADAALDELAAALLAARDLPPAAQLCAIADLGRAHLEPVELRSAIDDLLVDRVAVDGAGHPLLLAVVAAEAGLRAGLAVGVAAGPGGVYVAHCHGRDPLLADPASGAVRDADRLRQPVTWQCAHQVAARILNRIGERAERVGNVAWALRAAQLRLALPFDGAARERLEADLRRMSARLNEIAGAEPARRPFYHRDPCSWPTGSGRISPPP